jgi:hypothetical protein
MITREFVLAGRAIFTVSNDKNEWYTFKAGKGDFVYFVGLLTGPEHYQQFGRLNIHNPDSPEHQWQQPTSSPARVFRWAIRRIWLQDSLPQGYKIEHAGKCGRCGRLLTTPESIEIGLGPKCRSLVS